LQTLAVTGDLGDANRFTAAPQAGSLAAKATDRYAFILAPSELHSTVMGTVYLGVSVQAAGSGLRPAVPAIPGLTPLVSRTAAGSAFALFALGRDGLQIVEVAGADASTSGA